MGSGCCYDQTAGLLKSADVVAACGLPAAGYLGQTRDGSRLPPALSRRRALDPAETFVMVSHPAVPAGAPAPTAPDPMLVWTWKKIPLRDALGYQAMATGHEPGLLDRQTILWAGRGRRIVGLHVSKQLCDESAAPRRCCRRRSTPSPESHNPCQTPPLCKSGACEPLGSASCPANAADGGATRQ